MNPEPRMSRLKSNRQASAGRPALHALAGAALILFAAAGLLRNAPAQAQAIAPSTLSNAAGKKPLLDAASNGVPIVNIATPSSGGVSHNLFSQFNVGANGFILNNRAVVGISTLGGTIAGNLQLQASPPARLVLAEVDSTNPSQLLGRLEVVGNKAEFVLANTNGITCNGCGFINTSRAVQATGARIGSMVCLAARSVATTWPVAWCKSALAA